MSDQMQEIRESFFIECEELLEALQDALHGMEDGDDSSETINVAFRAVHSIKGGAGAFGLDQLVAFAHTFETAMDEVRAGRLEVDAGTLALFFQSGDMLSDLVRAARNDEVLPDETTGPLLAELRDIVGAEEDAEDEVVDFQPLGLAIDLPDLPPLDIDPVDDGPAGPRVVGISFRPDAGLYASGNEPVFLLRALRHLGEAEVTCTVDAPPDLADYGAATSLLSWRISLVTEAPDDTIREVFEFVEDLCDLAITDEGPAPVPPAPGPGGGAPSDTPPAAAVSPGDAGPAEPAAGPAALGDALPPADAGPDTPAPDAPDDAPGATKAPVTSARSAQPAAKPTGTVRVDLDRIDRLVNLVGELVINQAMLAQSVSATGLSGNTKIAAGLDEFQQLTRDIQDSVMMIRAQPVKSLFQRMSRIVREASADVGKTVRLRTEGENTEIDKTVIERLADPLTHMIRNAVDHGLESPEARRTAGKPAEGQITLTAAHRSGRVVIEISDDGGGINRPKVLEKAIEKGLVSADQDLTDSEIDNILFLPGFSTAQTVSNLSGRGVGMDVVKNAITALGGRIAITSHPGTGTTFSISLPLTLAVLDGMVLRVAGETLVMPLSAISETLSIQDGDARAIDPNSRVIRVRDSFVPLVDLAAELGYAAPRSGYQGATVLLISHEDDSRAALVVDEIEDQRQVVIKGLEDSYGRVPGVAAATILGDGQIALILDPVDLLSNASGIGRPGPALAMSA